MTEALPPGVLSVLIEESIDGVVIIDAQGRIRYVNAAFERLCGYKGGELLGEPLKGLLPDEEAPMHDARVRHYLESFRPSQKLGHARELSVRHRSGEIIPVLIKAMDLGVSGGIRFFGAFVVDYRMRKSLEARNAALVSQLEKLALTDALTGLPNRHAFASEAPRLIAQARRQEWPVTVGLADLDWFKTINDQHGHLAGDEVLRSISAVLQNHARAGDLICRSGGEEFGLLFCNANLDQAVAIAERIRNRVAGEVVRLPSGEPIQVTISIGLAEFRPDADLNVALAQADDALYEAKHSGRDRVVAWAAPLSQRAVPRPSGVAR